MIEDKVRGKIESLIKRAAPIVGVQEERRNEAYYAMSTAWTTEALNIVALAIPNSDQIYRKSIERASIGGTTTSRITTIVALFQAMLPDIDAGLIGDLGNKVRAETFDNFLDHAIEYLKEGRKNEAGVISGVVFEDTVRKIHADKIGDPKGMKLEDVINGLAKKDVITGQQSKQAKVGAHVRTKATHAQWEEFDMEGVDATIRLAKAFLREHLGG